MYISFFFPRRIRIRRLLLRLASDDGNPRRAFHSLLLFCNVSDCFLTCFKCIRSSPVRRSPTVAPNCFRVSSSPDAAASARQILTRTVSSGSDTVFKARFSLCAATITENLNRWWSALSLATIVALGAKPKATLSRTVNEARNTVMAKINERIVMAFAIASTRRHCTGDAVR